MSEPAHEAQNEEWKDTSPDVFVNYSSPAEENSFDVQPVDFSAAAKQWDAAAKFLREEFAGE